MSTGEYSRVSWQPTGLIATPNHQDPSTWIEDIVVDTTDSADIYAATQGGVMKSTDVGITWLAMNKGLVDINPPYFSRTSAKGGYAPALSTGSELSLKYFCHSSLLVALILN
jgi:photosystem II stability/assembly factor-like uncharacterized protein